MNNNQALSDLMHDFFCSDPSQMRHKQLAKRMAFFKNDERGIKIMCEALDELVEVTRQKTKKETLLECTRNLMETLSLTAQQAMDALKIPADKQKEYAPLI